MTMPTVSGLSCLIVDDSKTIRTVVRRICEPIGFICNEAENGQIALDACKLSMPDFALVDWNMPVMNGIEFLRAMRQLPDGDKPSVVVCTTNNESEQVMEALEAGANEYIMKPFDADILRGKLEMLGILPVAES